MLAVPLCWGWQEANGLRNLDDVVVLHAVKMLSALESAMPKIAWRRLSADNAVAALDIAALQLKSRTWYVAHVQSTCQMGSAC